MTTVQMNQLVALNRAGLFYTAHAAAFGAAPKRAAANVLAALQVAEHLRGKQDPLGFKQLTAIEEVHRIRRELRSTCLQLVARVAVSVRAESNSSEVKVLRTPHPNLPSPALMDVALEMVRAIRAHHELFLEHGLPEETVGRIEELVERLRGAVAERQDTRRALIQARAEIAQALRKGMRALRVLEGILIPLMHKDSTLRAGWESARVRIHVAASDAPAHTPADDRLLPPENATAVVGKAVTLSGASASLQPLSQSPAPAHGSRRPIPAGGENPGQLFKDYSGEPAGARFMQVRS
jgi:hypothetical protein